MNIKQIKSLAEIMNQSDLSALEITEGDNHIRLERERVWGSGTPAHSSADAAFSTLPASSPTLGDAELAAGGSIVDFNDAKDVKSPMVGVFYSAPSPGAQPYVAIGSKVKKGDVLCIVEAMKLMNEITSDLDGEIVDICVMDGDVVEFGQPLFKIC